MKFCLHQNVIQNGVTVRLFERYVLRKLNKHSITIRKETSEIIFKQKVTAEMRKRHERVPIEIIVTRIKRIFIRLC